MPSTPKPLPPLSSTSSPCCHPPTKSNYHLNKSWPHCPQCRTSFSSSAPMIVCHPPPPPTSATDRHPFEQAFQFSQLIQYLHLFSVHFRSLARQVRLSDWWFWHPCELRVPWGWLQQHIQSFPVVLLAPLKLVWHCKGTRHQNWKHLGLLPCRMQHSPASQTRLICLSHHPPSIPP